MFGTTWSKANVGLSEHCQRGAAGVVGPGLLGLMLTVQVAFIAAQLPSAPANYAAAAAKFQWTTGLLPCDAALADPSCTQSRSLLPRLARVNARVRVRVTFMDRIKIRASICALLTR